MEGQAGAAEHNGIPAVADGEGIDVAKVGRRGEGWVGLTRHVHEFVSARENKLRVDRVVRLDKSPFQLGPAAPGGKEPGSFAATPLPRNTLS